MDIGRAKQADVLFIKKGNRLQKLIFVFLSSRTKDKTTEQACKRLFSTYKSASEIANADIKAIEELIKPVAFYRQKAKRLKELCKIIAKNGIPDNFQELIKLPGIGRKSAAVFLAENQKPFVGVDTHVHRISNRLNLVKTEKEIETEKELQFLNDYNKRNINIAFVAYGQTVCKPINPLCNICPVSKCCYYAYKNKRGFWARFKILIFKTFIWLTYLMVL
jgi:endonuclease-3